MRKSVLAAGTALFIAGCGSAEHEPQTVTGSSEVPQAHAMPQPPKAPTEKQPITFDVPRKFSTPNAEDRAKMKAEPQYAALIEFRRKIIEQRKANVVKGLCIVWANHEGGITATLNPGSLTKRNKDGSGFSYPLGNDVFPNSRSHPLSPTNGPATITEANGNVYEEGQAVLIDLQPSAKEEVRLLSEQPVKDAAGRIYFRDKKTGGPLMLTDTFDVPLDPQTAQNACISLMDHVPFPPDENESPSSYPTESGQMS